MVCGIVAKQILYENYSSYLNTFVIKFELFLHVCLKSILLQYEIIYNEIDKSL